jgi:hypothetical protein
VLAHTIGDALGVSARGPPPPRWWTWTPSTRAGNEQERPAIAPRAETRGARRWQRTRQHRWRGSRGGRGADAVPHHDDDDDDTSLAFLSRSHIASSSFGSAAACPTVIGPVWIHVLELVLASLSSTSHKVSKHEG